jgi:hypothetical protein
MGDDIVASGGAPNLLDGKVHVGLSVEVSSGAGLSTLMIPDVSGVKTGQPIYITKPIGIVGKSLKDLLRSQGVSLPPEVERLIEETSINCGAFYYSKDVMLMMFELKFDKGLLGSLTNDPNLGNLFDVKSFQVRVIKCPKQSFDLLEKYVAGLSEKPTSSAS